MFGYMTIDTSGLAEEEQDRYKQVYCGLCHTLGTRLGQITRLTLSHDITFVALLLMSLYEPTETLTESGCPAHPIEKRTWSSNECIDYAADMNVVLMYHKCLDDWNDDRDVKMRTAASLLRKSYEQAQVRWPRQCAAMEQGLARISQIESSSEAEPDAAGNVFGMIMGELMVMKSDIWEDSLRKLGQHLGRFIYQMDAACDLEDDVKSGSFNPFANRNLTAQDIHILLTSYMAGVTKEFEKLPLIQDERLLRSVLYSGVWNAYNKKNEKAGFSAWR